MYPINNINDIEEHEKQYSEQHGIILIFVKPSDKIANEIIDNFNYMHKKSKGYCNIYVIGYSEHGNNNQYDDVKTIEGIQNHKWEYSDECFIEVCEELEKRLKNWYYVGEPEMIFLKNNINGKNSNLDFRNYNYIDISYGIRKGYIDSFPRFMERIFRVCKTYTNNDLIKEANKLRFNAREILQLVLEYDNKIPNPIKDIIGDRNFFKSCKTN